jgi:S-adenosylmethionine hydrolase
LIAFMSDWGYKNYYVGVAKSVMKQINSDVEIIDLVHGVEPFNVRMGAYMLQRSVNDFPKGTVFLVVIDQGVGTARKAMAFESNDGYFFVGPDNGVFTFAIEEHGVREMVELTNPEYFYRKKPSSTFHGRDIFAPVAAHISKGVPLKNFGPHFLSYATLHYKKFKIRDGRIFGEIAYYDGFGNLETNIPASAMKEIGKDIDDLVHVRIGRRKFEIPLVRAFGEVKVGELLIHEDSSGYLEIAVNQGSARNVVKADEGEEIVIW